MEVWLAVMPVNGYERRAMRYERYEMRNDFMMMPAAATQCSYTDVHFRDSQLALLLKHSTSSHSLTRFCFSRVMYPFASSQCPCSACFPSHITIDRISEQLYPAQRGLQIVGRTSAVDCMEVEAVWRRACPRLTNHLLQDTLGTTLLTDTIRNCRTSQTINDSPSR